MGSGGMMGPGGAGMAQGGPMTQQSLPPNMPNLKGSPTSLGGPTAALTSMPSTTMAQQMGQTGIAAQVRTPAGAGGSWDV